MNSPAQAASAGECDRIVEKEIRNVCIWLSRPADAPIAGADSGPVRNQDAVVRHKLNRNI
ncbi:MAG: hypothetical protein HYR63_00630 [Proteobacteria bacterium]|nr:hypothetical protein [Pseudomonadota bacterium]MBI3499325.1 hypothetical protein [Pseudomonadota bacterium]